MATIKNIFNIKNYTPKTWVLAFSLLCLSFSPILFNFIWGNHDWIPIQNGTALNDGLIEGRITQYIFAILFLEGKVLPILNTTLGFFVYCLSLIILSKYFFEFKNKNIIYTIIICTIATLPYICEIIYFQFIVLSQLFWTLTIVISLLFAKKATQKNPLLNTFLSTLFLLTSICGYPASSNLFITSTILYALNLNSKNKDLKTITKKLIPFIINFLISFSILYLAYNYMLKNEIMVNSYNNDTLTVIDAIKNIPYIIKNSILSLIQPQPFFSLNFKIITFSIIVYFLISYLCTYSSLKDYIIRLSLILILFVGIKFSALLTRETASGYFAQHDPIAFVLRTDFYSIPTLLMYGLLSLSNSKYKFNKNICYIFSILLLITNININLHYSKIQFLGFKAELDLLNRIINRVQSNKNYIPQNFYTLIQTGEISLRSKYYIPQKYEKYGFYTLQTAFTRYWLTKDFYNFYLPYRFVLKGQSILPEFITPQLSDFISNNSTIWPHPNSIYVDDKYIIITTALKEKNIMSEQFKKIKKDINL